MELLFALPQPALALQSLMPGPQAQQAAAEARRGDTPSVRLTLRHDYELVSHRTALAPPHRTAPHRTGPAALAPHILPALLPCNVTSGAWHCAARACMHVCMHFIFMHACVCPAHAQDGSTGVRITYEETLAQALGLPFVGALPELMAPALPDFIKPPKSFRCSVHAWPAWADCSHLWTPAWVTPAGGRLLYAAQALTPLTPFPVQKKCRAILVPALCGWPTPLQQHCAAAALCQRTFYLHERRWQSPCTRADACMHACMRAGHRMQERDV